MKLKSIIKNILEDRFLQSLMDKADDSMVASIIWRMEIKSMTFEKAVEDTLKKNRKNIDPNRKNSIINKAKEELKKYHPYLLK